MSPPAVKQLECTLALSADLCSHSRDLRAVCAEVVPRSRRLRAEAAADLEFSRSTRGRNALPLEPWSLGERETNLFRALIAQGQAGLVCGQSEALLESAGDHRDYLLLLRDYAARSREYQERRSRLNVPPPNQT